MLRTLAALTLFLATALPAQLLGPGTYEITNLDGTPVREGLEVGADVSFQDTGIVADVWIDRGNGKEYIPGEKTTLTQIGLSSMYEWTNANGNSGLLFYNDASEQWESVVLTGPNAGTWRAWTPSDG